MTVRYLVGFAVFSVAVVGVIVLVLAYGQSHAPGLRETAEGELKTNGPFHFSRLFHVLLALVSILLLGRCLGKLFVRFHQPRVLGEMVAGIMLGPSLLGQIWPTAQQFILPADVAPLLRLIADLGVILYMFVVGLELNAGLIRSRARETIVIANSSIMAPFLLGVLLALGLYPYLSSPETPFVSFAMFMGIAMSITAFPMLARILTDRKMDKSALGVLALSCAAFNDVMAWCILAFVVGVAQASVENAVVTNVLALGYIAIMLFVVRPLALRFLSHHATASPDRTAAWVLVGLLFSAMTAEWIGIYAIFGAFLLGAVVPHDSDVAVDFRHKLEDIVCILLLPAFFAYTGMRTEIGLVSGWQAWGFTLAIIVVATLGKFGGTCLAAVSTGLDWRTGSALGALMNTRGLMELVVLNIGLELNVISPTLFAMMVIMAVVTTIATTPMLWILERCSGTRTSTCTDTATIAPEGDTA